MRLPIIAAAALALSACETLGSLTDPLGPAPDAGYQTTASSSAAPAAAASGPLQTPEQQLLEAERRVAAMAQERGLGGALAHVLDAEGFVVRPGVIYQGADAVQRGLPTTTTAPVFWQPDRAFVADSNDLGMTSGRFVQVVQGAEAVQGRYVIVWRREAGGEWRALSETRIPDPQAAPARRR